MQRKIDNLVTELSVCAANTLAGGDAFQCNISEIGGDPGARKLVALIAKKINADIRAHSSGGQIIFYLDDGSPSSGNIVTARVTR